MDSVAALRWGPAQAVVTTVLLCFLVECQVHETWAQTSKRRTQSVPAACAVRDVRSSHFVIHTDLSAGEADELVERLETMLRLITNYWGRPMQGTIECYVVRDLEAFPLGTMDPDGIWGIKTAGGVTLMRTVPDGKRYLAKAVVYACARTEVVQHEVVHAYCHQSFGRIGPVWYSEGMAEMGHYWSEGDRTVRAESREIEFLREHPPKSLADTISPTQLTGDSWQNYASRWALCHFLIHHPNYSRQFLALGRGLLAGKEAGFQQAFGAAERELWFEYQFFLQHIGPSYRVDLCAWDWNKKFASLCPGGMLTVPVAAGRGWQATGLTVRRQTQYEYVATGCCRIAGETKPVNADGDDQGRGRLVGVLMKDYRLSREFELGTEGSLQLKAEGDLYLRCRNVLSDLAGDSGRFTVKLRRQGRGLSQGKLQAKDRVAGGPLGE